MAKMAMPRQNTTQLQQELTLATPGRRDKIKPCVEAPSLFGPPACSGPLGSSSLPAFANIPAHKESFFSQNEAGMCMKTKGSSSTVEKNEAGMLLKTKETGLKSRNVIDNKGS